MNNQSADWTPATVQPNANANDNQIDLGELFALLWRRKWVVAAFFAVMTLLSIAYVQKATPLYQAQATLILEAEEQNITGLEGLVGGISNDDAELNSQIEVIRSREIVGVMVDKLGLAEDKEFVSELREPSWIREQIAVGRRAVVSVVSAVINVFSPRSEEPTEVAEVQERTARDSAIDTLVRNLNITVIPNTHVFLIKLETTSAEKSSRIVNTLAETFVADKITSGIESTSIAAEWLGAKVADLGEKLAEAEAKAADYRSNTERNVTDLDVAASNVNLKNARGRLNSFETNLEAATGSRIPRTDRDRNRYANLQEDIEQLESIVRKQTEDLLKIKQLDREALAATTIYAHFATRLNEIEVQKGLQESDIRILSRAIPRFGATKPKKFLTVAFAGLLGLLMGSAYVILRRIMDRSFNDPSELQSRFGIKVVGTIPRAPVKDRRALLRYAIKRPASSLMEAIRDMRTSLNLTASDNTGGRAAGDGKVLVMTSSVPGEGKTTSSILLAVNSAALGKKVLLIECDLRRSTFRSYFNHQSSYGLVDLIDRKEGCENAIWHEESTKIDIVYGGRKAVDESSKIVLAIRKYASKFVRGFLSIFGIDGASKGARDKNAADVFASTEFRTLIDEMRAQYDLIILDSPPVLPVPDARLIAKVSDAVVYVVHSGATPASVVADGLRLFENIGVKIDGLNLTQMKQGSGYGYGYYGGYSNKSEGYFDN